MKATNREMTTALFLLRAGQVGVSVAELELLTIGMVNDMYIEHANDYEGEYETVATQDDIDAFFDGK